MKLALLIPIAVLIPLFTWAFPAHEGRAFVYPQDMHGRSLPSGELFRHDRLTAGHASIPIGNIVRVTNLANGRKIDVLITDRRPSAENAIFLTNTAAQMIGLTEAATVRIEQLKHPVSTSTRLPTVHHDESIQTKTAPRPSLYFLEFASYKNPVQARMLATKVTKKGAPSRVVTDPQGLHHVISRGYFTTLEEASKAHSLVSKNVGYIPVIKRI